MAWLKWRNLELVFHVLVILLVAAIVGMFIALRGAQPVDKVWSPDVMRSSAKQLEDGRLSFNIAGTRVASQCDIVSAQASGLNSEGVAQNLTPIGPPVFNAGANNHVVFTIEYEPLPEGEDVTHLRSCAKYRCTRLVGSDYYRDGCTTWVPVSK